MRGAGGGMEVNHPCTSSVAPISKARVSAHRNARSRQPTMQPLLRPPATTRTHVRNRVAHRRAVDGVHTGEQYHDFMLASQQDRAVRDAFQSMALDLLPAGADILDFGAGTGIDAKVYAAKGHPTFVYEPSPAMHDCLMQHCRDEIACNTIVPVTRPFARKVQAITANFAVLNHVVNHRSLFEEFSRAIDRGGFVLASMLSPYHLGDARHRWWWANQPNLVRKGCYPSPGESRIHRFAPHAVARAAAPHFRLERLVPRGFGLASRLYMFLLFRRV